MFVLHSNGRWLFVCFSILHIVKNMYKTRDWVTEASCRTTGVCSNQMFSFTTFGKEKKKKPKMLGFSLGLWWSSRLEMNSVSKTVPPSGRQCETEMNFGGLVGVCVVRRSIAPSSWFFLKDNGLLGKMGGIPVGLEWPLPSSSSSPSHERINLCCFFIPNGCKQKDRQDTAQFERKNCQ